MTRKISATSVILATRSLPSRPTRPRLLIRVVLSCDIDGILHIEVFDLTGGKSLGEFEIERDANLDQDDVEKMRDALARLVVQ